MKNYFRNFSTEKKIEKHCFQLLEKYEAHKIQEYLQQTFCLFKFVLNRTVVNLIH